MEASERLHRMFEIKPPMLQYESAFFRIVTQFHDAYASPSRNRNS